MISGACRCFRPPSPPPAVEEEDEKKPAGRYGRTPEEMQSAIDKANEIKALRAAQATVLHATPGANGNNFIPVHIQVYQAGMEERARRAEQGARAMKCSDLAECVDGTRVF